MADLPVLDTVFKVIDKVGGIADVGLDRIKKKYEPAADYGFFGPGSVAWRVWMYPSSAIMGFQRAVTIEQLDPNLNAAVEASGGVRARTRTRYERTMRYFALVAAGDTASATKASDILVKVHSKGIGIDPVTGGKYNSNSPESQLWIHMTAWHSILYCYEIFGPGGLRHSRGAANHQPRRCSSQSRQSDCILRVVASAPCRIRARTVDDAHDPAHGSRTPPGHAGVDDTGDEADRPIRGDGDHFDLSPVHASDVRDQADRSRRSSRTEIDARVDDGRQQQHAPLRRGVVMVGPGDRSP